MVKTMLDTTDDDNGTHVHNLECSVITKQSSLSAIVFYLVQCVFASINDYV
jgi:hypothetical protein